MAKLAPPGRLTLIFPAGLIFTSHLTGFPGPFRIMNPTLAHAGRLACTYPLWSLVPSTGTEKFEMLRPHHTYCTSLSYAR